jgi:phytoene desaturase
MAFASPEQYSLTLPIVIVGGGLGGLAAAIRLAAHGRRVVLCEKNERVGGKLNIVAEEGYTFDTGPSLLTMPWVLRELFAAAGRRLEDELTLIQVDPTCRYRWPDGARFDAFQSLPLLMREIAQIEPRDAACFFRFMAYAERIYRAVAGPFLLRPFDGLRDLLTPAALRGAWAIDPFRTVDQAVRGFFRSPHLRQVFDRYATYSGSSPYRAPATFNLIAYIEFVEGAWYLRGGMYELARALERLACALGVEMRMCSPVAQVVVREGAARGVILETGERLDAAAVIVNADPRYAYEAIIPDGHRIAARLARLEPSCSGFVLLLGVDRVYSDLTHHNIFFSADYEREFAAIFDKRAPAPDPTVYVCATSISDPSHAPPGHMNLFVLVNVPALGSRLDWGREAAGYRDLVLHKLERMGLAGLDRHVVYERIITPEDLQSRYNAPGGAIYGLASNRPWTAFLRPPLRAREARGLFFVGGGTHPGGGIPLVLLSGRAVAERVLAE